MDTRWSIGKILEKWAFAKPNKTALIVNGANISYQELNQQTNQFSNLFQQLGLKKGDRVAGLYDTNVESISTYFACAKLGLICVPINNRLLSKEITYQLKNSGAKVVIYDSIFGDNLADAIKEVGLPKTAVFRRDGSKMDGTVDWSSALNRALENQPTQNPQVSNPVLLNDPLAIIYTSGTTGAPKGAVVNHLQTYFKCFNIILYTDMRESDIFLTPMPLFHSAGLFICLTPCIARGATLIARSKFDPQVYVEDCENYKATVIGGTTTMWKMILKYYDKSRDSFKSVRVSFGGGERTPQSLLEELESIGINMQLGFGQTENSFMAMQRPEDTMTFSGSVGKAGFFTDIWIQNNKAERVGPNENGVISAVGPTVMSAYWNMPEKTAATIVEGVLNTGDVGYMDEHQNIYLVDREKDMYRSGAENVYPAEVEKILLNHLKIFNVAIIGVPDDTWGETGKAFVVLKDKKDTIELAEMHEFLGGKLARYKYPRKLEILEALPQTATGKVRKVELKKKEGFSLKT